MKHIYIAGWIRHFDLAVRVRSLAVVSSCVPSVTASRPN